ncbi:MAG: DNA gyrase inhibitor YacG [Rhodobacteraceae bacterium]|nr:DNA gyrase inhibitor YacG [Paracoccaceae bacterium]MBR26738.1 DNA gyrase inhibitor YacG [Paracoccaceae bacterium]
MPCPMCKRPTVTAYRPFCSKRCADLDLGNWLNGKYAIPAEEDDAPDADDYARDTTLDRGRDRGRQND